jgi:flagellar secretion chaperone FliS
MAKTVYDRYLEAEVLSADPVKLVFLLYRGALEAVRASQRLLDQGDIRGRSREINRAWSILQELAGSLDHSQGEISRRLAGLYAYMQSRLIEANVKQAGAPLKDVEGLLAPLVEAWREAHSASEAAESEPEEELEAAALALG